MTENETGSEKIDPSEIESSLRAVSRKLSDSAQLKPGSILIRFTDSGEEYSIETTGREARMIRAAPATAPLVEVSGSSTVLKAIMDGRKEAARAFLAGGIWVQGDLPYLEALLKEIGLLQCA
jgi:putative sterol carrier protein